MLSMLKLGEDKALVVEEGGRGVVKPKVPSNVYLLNVAFYSFAIFALGQMYVAIFIARSQAMVGDSSAMVVDSLTYLFNSYAEKIKNKSLAENDEELQSETEKELRRLERTRQRLWLEILPPLCSVFTLIVLTIYITIDALNTLAKPEQPEFKVGEDDGKSVESNDEPDIGVMFLFSGLNLVLDILNVTCFARAKHAFGFAVIDEDRHRYMLAYDGSLHNQYADSLKEIRSEVDLHKLDTEIEEPIFQQNYSSIQEERNNPSSAIQSVAAMREEKSNNRKEVNLNMCSAYTHVFADTMRSTAVLIAAGLSYTLNLGEPGIVDAVAALAVSLIILFSLGPLLRGIFHAIGQMRRLTKLAEERPISSSSMASF